MLDADGIPKFDRNGYPVIQKVNENGAPIDDNGNEIVSTEGEEAPPVEEAPFEEEPENL